ncbi:MAG: hypothetical protein ACFCD0_23065 [Gemmataceae bacterium]
MHIHSASCLVGPISASRAWWQLANLQDVAASDEAPQTLDPEQPMKDVEGAGEIRHDLVDRIRREIASGTYDTAERWDAALDRLCDELEVQE